jgi:hypothetical protein
LKSSSRSRLSSAFETSPARKGIFETTLPAPRVFKCIPGLVDCVCGRLAISLNVITSVASSLAGIDEALKLYAQGVDEWRETIRSLEDAEEEVDNIMRDREILCVVLFFVFFVSYFFFVPELLS